MSYKKRVQVQACNDWLRLYWRESGKPKYLSLGIPDGDAIGRVVAAQKAALLEADLLSGNLDPTLNKYRFEEQRTDCVTPGELMRQYHKTRQKHLDTSTSNKYLIVARQLDQVFPAIRADDISEKQAEKFRQFLLNRQKPITTRDRLFILKACWQWAIEKGAVKENPWIKILDNHEVPLQQRPKPFTVEECKKILDYMETHRYFSHYVPYVEFMLLCGFRPSEAIGLKWKHLNEDCTVAWIGEMVVRRKRKPTTKTKQERYFRIPDRVAQKLRNRRGHPDELVFPGTEGGAMDDNNFCKRVWATVLKRLEIPYRKPYTTRSTAISHWMESGKNPVDIAEATGHDVQTLLRHYAGSVKFREAPPDFLDFDDFNETKEQDGSEE